MTLHQWARQQLESTIRGIDWQAECSTVLLSPTNPYRQQLLACAEEAKAPYIAMLAEIDCTPDLSKCPICGSPVTSDRSSLEYSVWRCDHCNQYRVEEEYGNTEITIGQFMAGFSYDSPDRQGLWEKVYRLGRIRQGGIADG